MSRKPRNAKAPWSVAGGPDPDFADVVRETHHSALTAADLLDWYRRRFPREHRHDYEAIVRRLGYVWDCPQDGAASVVGYRCPACGQTRAVAMARPRRRLDRAANVAYVRRLCTTYAERGLDAMLELVPWDVEWIPHLAEGRVLRGTEELREFLAQRSPQGAAPQPTQIEPVGKHVLVRFESPGRDPGALWSLYLFAEGRLVRAISFDRKELALNAAA